VPRYASSARRQAVQKFAVKRTADSLSVCAQHTLPAAQAIFIGISEPAHARNVCKLCGIAPDCTSATWRSTATPPPRGRRRALDALDDWTQEDEIASWVSVRV